MSVKPVISWDGAAKKHISGNALYPSLTGIYEATIEAIKCIDDVEKIHELCRDAETQAIKTRKLCKNGE